MFRNAAHAARAVLTLLFASTLLHPVHAQQAAPAKPVVQAHRGIQVSGWWTLTVLNPDGSPGQRVEFENSITAAGKARLNQLLNADIVSGGMDVYVGDPSGTGACPNGGCYLFVSGTGTNNTYGKPEGSGGICSSYFCFATLKQAVDAQTVTLTGYITAPQNGNISTVGTTTGGCGASFSPADCTTQFGGFNFDQQLLTSASVSPITLTKGQILQVKVVLSFS